MRKVLTDRVIRGLRTDKAQEDFWDRNFTGGSFGVRVTKAGTKTFICLYRDGAGKLKRRTLGRYDDVSLADARKNALNIIGTIAGGEEPTQEGEAFADLADDFIRIYPKRENLKESTVKEYKRLLKANLLPAWGKRSIHRIKRRDVETLLDEIAYQNGTPVLANRTKALASCIFNFGIDQDRIQNNPCLRVKNRVKEKGRDRVLSDDEIRALWEELGKRREVTASIYKLILMTAQRPGEVKKMQWEEIDGDVWTIPAEKTKSRARTHRVPLTDPVLEIIEETPRMSGWVFTSRHGKKDKPIHWLQATHKRITDSLGFHFTPHDLRRTAATNLSKLGVSDTVIARILNHSWVFQNMTTSVYNRDDRLPEMRQALERWNARLEQILTEEPAKVVRMR